MIAFFEIPTNDFNKSVAFYHTLFREQLAVSEFGDDKMACIMKDGKSIGSISSVPSFNGLTQSNGGVLVYFTTGDLEGDLKKATENGVTLITPNKTKIQVEDWGYFAIIEDPIGNRIGLYGED